MKLLALLFLLASQASASTGPVAGSFWDGEASPGRLEDSSANNHDLGQVNDPGNPSTPAPVFFGSKWLGGKVNMQNSDLYTFPLATISNWDARITYEFGIHYVAGSGYFPYNDDGALVILTLEIGDAGDGNFFIKYLDTTSGLYHFTVTATQGIKHRIKVEIPASGASDGNVYIDGILVIGAANWTRPSTTDPTTRRLVSPINGAEIYIDAFMMAEGWADAYPAAPPKNGASKTKDNTKS